MYWCHFVCYDSNDPPILFYTLLLFFVNTIPISLNVCVCVCKATFYPVTVALVIGETIPSSALLDKWFGEPIKAVVVPTSIFVINKKGIIANVN